MENERICYIEGQKKKNTFYPFHNSLAYSDLFITTSFLTMLPMTLTKEPIVVVNLTLLISLVLLGFSIFLLCFYLTKDFLASLLAGVLVIFSPAVLDKTTHLQVLSIWWVPLAILFFLLFLNKNKFRYLLISLFCFLLQTYNSFLPGYFIIFSCIVILITFWFLERKKVIKVATKKTFIFTFISLLFLLPIIIPYYTVSNEFNYVRDIRDSIHLGLHFEDLLYANNNTYLKDFLNNLTFNKISQNGEFKAGYIGLVFSLLALYGVYFFLKHFKALKRNLYIVSFLSIAVLGLVTSLGPFLHINRHTVHDPFPIPLPYALFYYTIPGFQGFRNAARWEMLFIIGIIVVIALILHYALRKYSAKKRIIIYCLLIFGCIVEFNFPMRFEKIATRNEFPEVYSWLQTTPQETKIVEMPIHNWNMWPYTHNELFRQYYSSIHFRKTINGASGFSPPPWQSMIIKLLVEFPSDNSIKTLKDLDISYIIIHKSEYDRLGYDKYKVEKRIFSNGSEVIKELSKNPSIKFTKQFEDDYVFQIIK